MEKEKYYTPTIDEFYVGFEYEVFEKGSKLESNAFTFIPHNEEDKYFKFKYPDPFYGYNLDKLFQQKQLKVKYLDQEDIESLGWVKISVKNNLYKYKDYTLIFKNSHVDIFIYGDWDGEENCFSGVVKNKSELKKLMRMLEIADNQ